MRSGRRARTGAAAAAALALVVAGCGGGDDGGGGGEGGGEGEAAGPITVWTLEDVQDRITATEALVEQFTQDSGIEVDLVPVAEDQFQQVLTSAAAEGDLPDVIAALGLSGVQSLNVEGLLDTDTAAAVVEDLGEDTFSEAALELTRDGDTQLAVPSDAWAQLLVYRTDLFEAAGLEPPTTYESLRTAAETLNAGGTAGIVLATTPGDAFTQQTFEYLALGNDCQLVDDEGQVTLDSEECVEAFELYDDLAASSVAGNQDVDTTRANYFAGTSAMVIWSSFILDELAGLRDDALPTCAECAADPTYLAQNSGVVGPLSGPSGDEAQYGEVVSWTITADADPDAAGEFVRYMMDDAYVDWLALAPEGKVPVRSGTEDSPEQFVEAWGGLEAGVDRKAPLSDVYSPEVIETILGGTEALDRWGLPQGQGELVGATLGELPVPEALSEMVSGGTSPQEAADQAQTSVSEIAESLG